MKFVLNILAALLVLLMHEQSWAQSAYPNRPVHIVVGFPAGTAPDISARILAAKSAESWGVPVTTTGLLQPMVMVMTAPMP